MIKVNYNDINLKDGIPDAGGGATFFYKGEPFTGIVQYFYSRCAKFATLSNAKI